MKKIIALLACLWALCAGATNITNYPVRTTFNANYWFLLSDVAAQTNWNLPGNYVASTSDLNNLSNIVMNISNFTSITVTNPITNLSLTANTVLEADANKAIASIPNGTGLLANNGLGGFSWISVSSFLTNAPWDSITNYIDGNLSQVWSNTTSGSYSIVTTNLDITHTNGSDYRNTVGGNVDVSGTYTSASATANTISKWDANKALASVANGTGLLTNSGGGTFGWLPLSDLTNFSSSVTISNVYIRFATISNLIVLSNAYFLGTNFFDTITVTNPITNLSLTANTIVKSDANKALASVLNGSGILTNDGSGIFGWAPVSDLVLTNPPDLYYTNLYVTNLYVYSNLYAQYSYISNLYVTNITAKNMNVQNIYSISNFFDNVTVTNGLTNLNLTANSLVKSDANKALASVANGTGALTNNGSGTFGWFGAFATTNDILTVSNNIITQVATNTLCYTNLSTMAPDFAKPYSAITTNASFAFLAPLNVEGKTQVQTAVVRVDNSSGSAIVATAPANVIVISNSFMGVGANGTTWFTFVSYPQDRTNVYANAETR